MTVNYNLSVSTSRPWTFFKLFFRWDGSVWKAVWIQYAVWLALYFMVSIIYRFLLDQEQRRSFAVLADYLDARLNYIPLSWMLGFFVTAVLARWKYLYNIIGWIDNIALVVAMYVRGKDERARMYRRNIIRYCMLTQVLVFRDLSMKCRKRLPTLDAVQAAGFMSQHERDRFEEIQYRYAKYWVPFQWAWALSYNARKEGLIEGDYYQTVISEEIKKFRTDIAWLCNYDWVPLPMIYPTIVCLSVHVYFLVAVIARQYVEESKQFHADMIFPLMTTVQFMLYMGWLKVAEALLNPWGEDDDDFETNCLIDRNLTMALTIVDEGYDKTPYLAKDDFWDHEWTPMYPEDFDYTTQRIPRPSMANIKLQASIHEIKMVPLHGEDSHSVLSRVASRSKIIPVKPSEQLKISRRRFLSVQEDRTASHASLFNMIRPLREQNSFKDNHKDEEVANGECDPNGKPRKSLSVSNMESLTIGGWNRLRRFSRSLMSHGDNSAPSGEMKVFRRSIKETNRSDASLADVKEEEKEMESPIERKESQILPALTLIEDFPLNPLQTHFKSNILQRQEAVEKDSPKSIRLNSMETKKIEEKEEKEDDEKERNSGENGETADKKRDEGTQEKEHKGKE